MNFQAKTDTSFEKVPGQRLPSRLVEPWSLLTPGDSMAAWHSPEATLAARRLTRALSNQPSIVVRSFTDRAPRGLWSGLPRRLHLFGQQAVWRQGSDVFETDEKAIQCPTLPTGGVAPMPPDTSPEQWRLGVDAIRQEIARETLSKAVLARQVTLTFDRDICPIQTAWALRERYPDSATYLLGLGDGRFWLGSTPETLVSVRGSHARCDALAGTCDLETSPAQLLASFKDNQEHQFVVSYIKQQLARVSSQVESSPLSVASNADLRHLKTDITAVIPNPDLEQLIEILHPTPAVCGMPPKAAETLLEELEHFDRGWYAGAIGYHMPNGDGTVGVALRGALIRGNQAHAFVGAGIVEDSRWHAEWQETELKLEAIRSCIRLQ